MLIGASCSLSVPPARTDFIVQVDSVTGPTAVSGGVAFESRLWGPIGPNGCYSFKELRTTRVPNRVDVTVIGEVVHAETCTQQPVALDGVVLRAEPIIPNSFMIVVHQPDGSTLVRNILGE
jgi:hypothetical protein